MTARFYRTPPPPASTRARCPVCGEAVYSRAGIHPQCAVRRADPPRLKSKSKGGLGGIDPATKASEGSAVDSVLDPPVAEIISTA
jgi:hypothetical protein